MSIEAMRQALDALDEAANVLTSDMFAKAADALRAAIEQAENQEPVGHADLDIDNIYIFGALEPRVIPTGRTSLYTAPRQWQGLTADEIWQCNTTPPGSEVGYHVCMAHQNVLDFAEAIEAKLKEKNT